MCNYFISITVNDIKKSVRTPLTPSPPPAYAVYARENDDNYGRPLTCSTDSFSILGDIPPTPGDLFSFILLILLTTTTGVTTSCPNLSPSDSLNFVSGTGNEQLGERDRYWTCIYIGPPRFLCLAMMCRLVWPTRAYKAALLVDWRSENGG